MPCRGGHDWGGRGVVRTPASGVPIHVVDTSREKSTILNVQPRDSAHNCKQARTENSQRALVTRHMQDTLMQVSTLWLTKIVSLVHCPLSTHGAVPAMQFTSQNGNLKKVCGRPLIIRSSDLYSADPSHTMIGCCAVRSSPGARQANSGPGRDMGAGTGAHHPHNPPPPPYCSPHPLPSRRWQHTSSWTVRKSVRRSQPLREGTSSKTVTRGMVGRSALGGPHVATTTRRPRTRHPRGGSGGERGGRRRGGRAGGVP